VGLQTQDTKEKDTLTLLQKKRKKLSKRQSTNPRQSPRRIFTVVVSMDEYLLFSSSLTLLLERRYGLRKTLDQ
jgi:hypothetical protein